MADNNNVEAVKFSNEKVRVVADRFSQLYYYAKGVSAEWTANNLGALFPLGDTVVDGAAQDGRHPITGNDVVNMINLVNEFIANMEASSGTDLNTVLNVAVHPQT